MADAFENVSGTGSLAEGKQADFVVPQLKGEVPALNAVSVGDVLTTTAEHCDIYEKNPTTIVNHCCSLID